MAGGFPKLGVPFGGGPHNKDYGIIAFWGVYWVPLILGKYRSFCSKTLPKHGPLACCASFSSSVSQGPTLFSNIREAKTSLTKAGLQDVGIACGEGLGFTVQGLEWSLNKSPYMLVFHKLGVPFWGSP